MKTENGPRVKHFYPLQIAAETSARAENSSRQVSISREMKHSIRPAKLPGPFVQERRALLDCKTQEMMASGNECMKGLAYMTHDKQNSNKDPLNFEPIDAGNPPETPKNTTEKSKENKITE